jgi:hypothetical protein
MSKIQYLEAKILSGRVVPANEIAKIHLTQIDPHPPI